MVIIGVICRGKYGKRLIETIKSKTDLQVISSSLPEYLPDFIDEPEEYLKNLNLDKNVFSADIIITYSLHPDLTYQIAIEAAQAGVNALIIPGGAAKAPVQELEQIAKKYNMHIEVEDICCNINENKYITPFTNYLSKPIVEIKTQNDIVTEVQVIKGAPCGSTWHMAEGLKGISIEDAPAKAGLLIQQYPCRAIRGTKRGIHTSAQIHKDAIIDALKKSQK